MTAVTKEVFDTKPSNPVAVDEFMSKLKHPLKDTATALRQIIVRSGKSIGEEISWNAPSFFYTGKMKPFNPKEFKRVIVVFNFFRKDCIRLIFLRAAWVDDGSGLLEGDYKDGRRLALFFNVDDVKAKQQPLQKVIKSLMKLVEKNQ